MSKYAEFDKALINQIKAGNNTMSHLDSISSLRSMTEPFLPTNGRETEPFRIIDRRLQALRKAGIIQFVNRVWEVV